MANNAMQIPMVEAMLPIRIVLDIMLYHECVAIMEGYYELTMSYSLRLHLGYITADSRA